MYETILWKKIVTFMTLFSHNRAPKMGRQPATRVGGMVRPYEGNVIWPVPWHFASNYEILNNKLVQMYSILLNLVNCVKIFFILSVKLCYCLEIFLFLLILSHFLNKIIIEFDIFASLLPTKSKQKTGKWCLLLSEQLQNRF